MGSIKRGVYLKKGIWKFSTKKGFEHIETKLLEFTMFNAGFNILKRKEEKV